MASNKKLRRSVTITAAFSLISFLYKFGLGILNMSVILMIAATSTLLVFIAKVTFLRNSTKTRVQKKKAYLVIAVVTLIYSLIFIAFSVLKVNGIDISNQKTYEGLYGAIFISIIFIMFVLSLLKLKGALEKNDIMYTGLKEIIFVSALTDLVIIEEFVSRIVREYRPEFDMNMIDGFIILGISITIIVIPIIMFIRFARYKALKN